MATDVEESDTDDHERPAPAKRLCTRLIVNEDYQQKIQGDRVIEKEEDEPTESTEFDEAEKYAREKLKRWQDCQFAKGFVDNTINEVLENHIMASSFYSPEDTSRFRFFRGNEMEDTAVMMAILNQGLVRSTEFISQPRSCYNYETPTYWNNDRQTISCYASNNRNVAGYSNSLGNTSRLRDNHGNDEEVFMERAVAEAIKKKGLNVLSVDYG